MCSRIQSLGAFALVASAATAASLSFAACSPSFSSDDDPKTTSDAAPEDASLTDAAIAVDGPAPGTNPYGKAYPAKFQGFQVRNGTYPGSVIPNLTFPGYGKNGALASTVQMADVYDPEGRTHDIVVVALEGMWAPSVKAMMDAFAKKAPYRIALFLAVNDGHMQSIAATLPELDGWRSQTNVAGWYGLDPQFVKLNALYQYDQLPSIAVVDARSMEIVRGKLAYTAATAAELDAVRLDVLSRPPTY